MPLVQLIDFMLRHLRVVRSVALVLLALLVLLDALLVDKTHAHTAIERLPGFWALFGLIGCVLIILVSKQFGATGIMKKENPEDE